MMKDSLKNMSLFIDGRGYGGAIDEIVLPKLVLKTQEYYAGGMDIPIEIELGMEKLECQFTLAKFDPAVLSLFGVSTGRLVPLTVRGSLMDEGTGTAMPVVIQLRGMIKEMDFGTWKMGEAAVVKVTVALRYYRYEQNNQVIHEIDAANAVRRINGTDTLETIRNHIGL